MARVQIAAFWTDVKRSSSYEYRVERFLWQIGKSIAEGLMNLFEPVESFSQAIALPCFACISV